MRVREIHATVIIPSGLAIGKNEDGETALSPDARINSFTIIAEVSQDENITAAALKLREMAGAAVETILMAASIAGVAEK